MSDNKQQVAPIGVPATELADASRNEEEKPALSKKQERKLNRKNTPITAENRFAGSKRGDAEANGPSKGFAGVSQRDEKRLYTTFNSRKQLWLSEIEKHSAPIDPKVVPDEADKSNKGFIDQRCLPIMALLNAHKDYVTTSSCSGRICLFHTIGGGLNDDDDEEEHVAAPAAGTDSCCAGGTNEDAAAAAAEKMKRGAEGSLGWILASHDSPLTEEQVQLVLRHTVPGHAFARAQAAGGAPSSSLEVSTCPSANGGIPSKGQVSFKCEPFLLHVQCRTIEAAKKLLNAAIDAGFRNSGMIPPGKNIMVGIRHASLSIDCPVVADGGVSFASEAYMRYLVSVAEEKMAENFRRTELLEKCIRRWISQPDEADGKQ